MTDEHLAAMHKLLAEYHRKLAKAAVLDIVQQYHVDLAQRFADEAVQIPRRTAILERLNKREQQEKMASTRLEPWMIM
jgi:Tfp pilus assembly protein PilO